MMETLRLHAVPAVTEAPELRVTPSGSIAKIPEGPTTTTGTTSAPSRGAYSVSTTYAGPSAVVKASVTRSANRPPAREPSARA